MSNGWSFYNAVRDAMRRMAEPVTVKPNADDDDGPWRSDMLTDVDPPDAKR